MWKTFEEAFWEENHISWYSQPLNKALMLQLVNYCRNNDDDDDDDTKKEKRNIFEGFRCDQYAQFLVN